ncbi:MAG: DUF411 domain-containing protein [Gemmatimonadota bacterium]
MNGKQVKMAGLGLSLALAAVAVWGLAARPGRAAGPELTLYKSAGCVCCNGWKKHMEAAGFRVQTVATERVHIVKTDKGVPLQMQSCHTAIVEGHVVEGHVPAEAVRRMLREPDGPYGLAAPGMPSGAPGMSGLPEPYRVIAFEPGGPGRVYASYTGTREHLSR